MLVEECIVGPFEQVQVVNNVVFEVELPAFG